MQKIISRFLPFPSSVSNTLGTLSILALPLPTTPYVYEEWSIARVGIDYHVEVDGHYYSVTFALVAKMVDIRATATTVEVMFKHNRVASHARNFLKGKHTPQSVPLHHFSVNNFTIRRFLPNPNRF